MCHLFDIKFKTRVDDINDVFGVRVKVETLYYRGQHPHAFLADSLWFHVDFGVEDS